MNGEVVNISKKYGKNQILRGVSFAINGGEMIGIIGANGSGKSTLLRILAGVIKADEGRFLSDGVDLLSRGAGNRVAYVPQGTPLIEELNAYDNLRLWYEKDALKKSLESGMLKELGIGDFLKKPVKKLSGGMRKRLSVGCSIANDPEIMLLDEPTAALDLAAKERLKAFVGDFVKRGGAAVLVTHDAQELKECTRCYLLCDGVLSAIEDVDGQTLLKKLNSHEK
ncbi:MAG: ABC transporter ATP-binding protein [Clostridiales bacterium]|nr:ABC transporter ATP-binding protein [Clostridiales bacterium]